ncbi:uncharacterized protein LOC127795894 [Diospyros lotus]|uniref:uncharacterized protein LOC127795894 n=1 Tax=Diospyros lotus TaxID=55363 RepID=UPI0022559E32|nr:uncharacterized protein LOC127795894 [Diospyros lotus]
MASIASPALFTTLPPTLNLKCTAASSRQLHHFRATAGGGLRLVPRIEVTKAVDQMRSRRRRCFKSTVSCSIAQPETLQIVQGTIAKQLSIDESTVAPQTKFADLGADSLDTVEIMMALEEKFGVSIGEEGAENISTVQEAADLIEKVKAAAAAA